MAKNESKALLFALATVLMWSTVASAFKLTLRELGTAQMLLVASLTTLVILTLVAAKQGKLGQLWPLLKTRPGYYLLLGCLNPCGYYLVLFAAYDLLPAQQAQALNYTWAISLSLLAVPFLGQKLSRFDALAIVLGYTGVLVIATRGQPWTLDFVSPLGVALALASTLIWSGYWIAKTRHQDDPVLSLLLGFALGLPGVIGALLWQGRFDFSLSGTLGAVYIGAFEMGFAFLLWLSAMKLSDHTARLSNLIFLSPFLSLWLLSTLVGEAILPSTLWGLGFILAGLGVQQLAKLKQQQK
ncbi:DMT family transporter [Gallaecimonas xiamenensis]|uniref:Drug/metabolite exporter family protein n=1 Tax=Gallaecimonas xiamenensis 3-C-1 TaxID=745411 RepID=K2K4Q3_9GAMM|nr:DMT family transporter [Gallaecimonas xiamenensis]EKE77934.1 drug/metabolite exporter family protein [Gallaecimonas xiamenensis 3-C-1]